MIKLSGSPVVEKDTKGAREVRVSLVADTKAEVIAIGANGSNVSGLQSGDKMTLGSTCLCANCDFGVLNSSGVWTF